MYVLQFPSRVAWRAASASCSAFSKDVLDLKFLYLLETPPNPSLIAESSFFNEFSHHLTKLFLSALLAAFSVSLNAWVIIYNV